MTTMKLVGSFAVVFVVFLVFLDHADTAVMDDKISANETVETTTMSIRKIERNLEDMITSVLKMLLPYVVRNSDVNISGNCMATFIKVQSNLRKLKVPIVKLLDANAKPPFGLLSGQFSIMGDYDECLSVSANRKGDVAETRAEETFRGQYCTVQMKLPDVIVEGLVGVSSRTMNASQLGKLGKFMDEFHLRAYDGNEFFNYYIGICMPSTCTPSDIDAMIKLEPTGMVSAKVKRCENNDPYEIATDQMVILCIFGVVILFVLIGTALDGIVHLFKKLDEKKNWMQVFLAFSAYTNTRKWLEIRKTDTGDVECINGMYALGTVLVIVYHTYFLPFFVYYSSKLSNLGRFFDDPYFTLISTMGVSIECYFLFSGYFLVYSKFKANPDKPSVNVIMLLIRRYIRIGPSVMIILGIIVVMPLFGSGPVWEDIVGVAADRTRQYWYTYFLMYNNFLDIKNINYLYLWFIPCLMQITVIGAILLWIFVKQKKLGIILIFAVVAGCNIALAVLTAIRNYPPSYAIYYFHDREKFEQTIYTGPLSHVPSFCIGMMLAYYMALHPTAKWSKMHICVGWILSFTMTVGTQYILFIWHDGEYPNIVFSTIYAGVHKTLFSLGVAWIIMACTYGYGGVISRIFSWKALVPLSKLGYLAYLTHYLVIAYHVSSSRATRAFTHIDVWYRIMGYVIFTFGSAYFLYIAFQLPLTALENFLTGRKPTKVIDNKSDDFVVVTAKHDVFSRHKNYQNNLCFVPNEMMKSEHSKL